MSPNYHPQRSVRTDRFKLIENLLPDTLNPDYADTLRKLEGDAKDRGQPDFKDSLPNAIAAAATEVRVAYAVMEKPPRYELYDLHSDPFEFRNLATAPGHAATLGELQNQLTTWREQTKDPLLDPQNLARLTARVGMSGVQLVLLAEEPISRMHRSQRINQPWSKAALLENTIR